MTSLLELLRKTLPESQEYLTAYVYLSYQLFTLLLETVQDFENSWLECLGGESGPLPMPWSDRH